MPNVTPGAPSLKSAFEPPLHQSLEGGIPGSAGDSSSRLDAHETTEHEASDLPPLESLQPYPRIRHGAGYYLRRTVFHAMRDAHRDDGRAVFSDKTLDRFRQCGGFAQVAFSPSEGQFYLSASCCRNRWCMACSQARRDLIKHNLTAWVKHRPVRFITLTLRHSEETLTQQLDRLKECIKRFRRRDSWKDHVDGFALFFEAKWSQRSHGWHVHAHILAEGSFWDTKELHHEWHAVTGDSFIADIRACTGEEGARYAAKYAAKPASVSDIPKEHLPTAIAALHGRRLWQTGGSWKALDLDAARPLPADLTPVASFNRLWFDAGNGDAAAAAVLAAVLRRDVIEVVTTSENPFDSS